GAGTVHITPRSGMAVAVKADPTRPTDVTDLVLDGSAETLSTDYDIYDSGVVMLNLTFLGFLFGYTTYTVQYQTDAVRLTVLASSAIDSPNPIAVHGSPAPGAIIDPGKAPVVVEATGGPVEIKRGQMSSLVLGKNGSTQQLQGAVHVDAGDPTLPRLQV